jgi:hypothetical protein
VLHEGEKDKIIQPNNTIASNTIKHASNEDIPHEETESLKHTPKPPLNQLPNFAAHTMYYLNLNLTPDMACVHSYLLEPIGLLLKEQMTQPQLHIPQHFL